MVKKGPEKIYARQNHFIFSNIAVTFEVIMQFLCAWRFRSLVLYNQDMSEPSSTMLTAVDIHKGFNKVGHTTTGTLFADINKPGWPLKIIVSYLSKRSLQIKNKVQMFEPFCVRNPHFFGTVSLS